MRASHCLRSAALLLVACPPITALAAASSKPSRHARDLVLASDLVSIHYHRSAGTMDVLWNDGHKLLGITSGARLKNGEVLSTSDLSVHELDEGSDPAPARQDYTVRSSSPGRPALLQHIHFYPGKPWLTLQAELTGSAASTGTRHFDVVMIQQPGAVEIGRQSGLRFLHAPFDNDMWFRWDSKAVSDMKAGEQATSEELTTIYDNTTRQGLVLGSITHDVWKSAIEAHAAAGQISDLDVYGGISSPTGVRTDTHDTLPHGLVHGDRVLSPRIFIGSFADWRDGLEAYGKANAEVQAPLPWPDGAPMGWNSWAAYANHINDHRFLGSGNFVKDTLVPQGFGRNGVVYLNLDAFWSALDAVQLEDAVDDIKSMQGEGGMRFKAGIYWTPFAYWSDDLDTFVEGTNMKYRYRDILLKGPDGNPLPKVDGGRAIDPSHPGAKARTVYYIQHFKQLGFEYLKLDFLSHGALEGVHYDPAIQTGTEAYNLGMKEIIDQNANRMFLSLSIAPLFPSGYGHARRLSCDTKGHINGAEQSTEYMLNALTYGWWTDNNLYITDPDHVVLGEKADQGARNVTEGKSRLLSAVISGGMILDSTRLADDPQGQQLAREVYSSKALFAVATEGKIFRPVEGNTGNKATDVFARPSAHGEYIAVFNYDDKQPQTVHVPMARVDGELAGEQPFTAKDVETGTAIPVTQDELVVHLQPAQSKLLEVTRAR